MAITVNSGPLSELDPRVLYRILQIRVDAFVVEQDCAYPDLDSLDLAPDTLLVWAEEDGEVLGTIRILGTGSRVRRIGRVATDPAARGRGVGGQLMRAGVELCAGADAVVIGAQAHLERWYGGFGFVRDGDDYLEDRIPHLPMRLPLAHDRQPEPSGH
ncbi:GNAT family N-acetyltransferase [Mycetocola reblochoni]|uniref:ElaA protein n=2 Tax=Mycetocola reblochoni TaxID=331618 RepID=A0A1R4KCT2_9MICO|nr:GNAT family N-acetyltransferase [Mycetocola reblochoni]RLP69265.1 GNAT family N-acetyltransferase [Mycetocola reblochoni]SJN41975.1 ElaA protein [Mycetocola reblochoni REB411]